MKKTVQTITFILLLFPLLVSAQRNCGSMDHLHQHQQDYPKMTENMQQIEKFTKEYIANYEAGDKAIITIPVVFNIVYKTSAQNVSDAQIQSQLDVLNDDFRRTNSDATNNYSQAADTEIEFCLATVDPSGNPTNGIRRKSTKKTSFSYSNDGVKKNSGGGLAPWDTQDYMNIWVCNLGSGLLGYAQFPGGNPATDGIVIDYAYFGTIGTATAPFNLGRTATHEVGHYLNLRHIWGDGGCSVDDFVSDTPLSDASNGGCATGHVSCGSVDMVENYMDYSDDACMNLFTQGQKARMLAALNGSRSGLISSNGCSGGNTNPEICDNGIDDDGDGLVDCDDSNCVSDPACQVTGGPCDAPTGMSSSPAQGGKKANLSWNAVSAATSYDVELRKIAPSTTAWGGTSTTNTTIQATGLTKNHTYEWRVRSVCGGDVSAWNTQTFVAGQSARINGEIADISIYPIPARNFITVEINNVDFSESTTLALSEVAAADKLNLAILNLNGQVMKQIQLNGETSLDINVNDLSGGLYFLRVEDANGNFGVSKFVVKR